MEYCSVVYDVPLTRKGVYNRLRARLNRMSIQMTWSCYLTPLHCRDQVTQILRELDEDEDTKQRIFYKVFKYDSSEKEAIDALVREQFEKHVKKTKDTMDEALGKAEQSLGNEEISLDDWALWRRDACAKAMKKIKEARRLATVFELTQVMEVAFKGFEEIIEAKRLGVKAEIDKVKDKAKAEAKVEADRVKAEAKAAKDAAKIEKKATEDAAKVEAKELATAAA